MFNPQNLGDTIIVISGTIIVWRGGDGYLDTQRVLEMLLLGWCKSN